MNIDAEQDLSNIVKQNIETYKRRKSSSRVLYYDHVIEIDR